MLRSAGVSVRQVPARIDEIAIRALMEEGGRDPRDVVDALGEFKARKGQDKNPDAVVLGSDQVLSLKGRVFGKPADREAAARQLLELQGQTHLLLSSAVIYHNGSPSGEDRAGANDDARPYAATRSTAISIMPGRTCRPRLEPIMPKAYGARLFSRIDGDWFSVLGFRFSTCLSFLRLRGWLAP
jgi:septum formation protein